MAIAGWRRLEFSRASEAAWFSVVFARATAPWAFARGETFRTIASLELLGVLMVVMLLTDAPAQGGEALGVVLRHGQPGQHLPAGQSAHDNSRLS